jgi:hypothetical protein
MRECAKYRVRKGVQGVWREDTPPIYITPHLICSSLFYSPVNNKGGVSVDMRVIQQGEGGIPFSIINKIPIKPHPVTSKGGRGRYTPILPPAIIQDRLAQTVAYRIQ